MQVQLPVWLQVLSIIAGLCGPAVAAWATIRARRIETEANVRLKRADQVHEEAKGIWTDASALRDELRRESERLRKERDELEAEKDAWITERRELRDRIAALERRVDDLACLNAPTCEHRQRPGK